MKWFRNILAVLLGFIAGAIVNSSIVTLGNSLYPVEGLDGNDFDALAIAIRDYEPIQFLFPFLAHAIGTFVGALITALIAASHGRLLAIVIGILFLFGGITMVVLVGGPLWFIMLDLVLAYLPMAYLGYYIAIQIRGKSS
ncbi:MAG: hypothetical protein WBA16_09610 [Nonlabens sp.]